ncbi:homeobox protein PKNOX1 isoform X4 [Macrotis lagotis]|uniref:homeobox protein PKNOX1 isoform X4 n=1 Tax=Macrotis lagotis TaxID=92651 RepID=UPI003D68BE9E
MRLCRVARRRRDGWTRVRHCGSRLLQPLVSVMKIGTQMQVVTEFKTEREPNCSDPDAEGVSPAPVESQTPMDADKQAIYRHPLFPLLALLFEKCEQSTQGSEGTTSASFDVDIENFVRKQEKEGKPFFCEDPETDNLMVKAIQVLRIHLLELEKVNELCKDFCSRYIACLKTKMNSETLLSGEPGSPYSPVQPQMQVVTEFKTEREPNCSDPDAEGVSPAPVESQTPMDADKQAIYRHPLFPLLALLFEKCEQSTQGSEGTTSASFDVDIENFVRKQEKEGKPFFCEDPETDNLMVKAIQVLRIHLLELEKVNELCKDFCSRYIACLKTKMNSETLLSGEPGSPYSPVQPQQIQSAITGTLSPQGIVVPASALQQGNVTMATVAGGTVYQPVTVVTPQGQVVTQALSPGTIRIQNSQLQLQLNQDLSILHQEDGSSKNKRGVLPKHATNVMRSWLFQHIGHPYPTEDEKKQIAAQTNLTLLQVNNWFINARRRILQPMLDSSCSETPKTKKKTAQNRPVQRFWPDSIASGVAQQPPNELTMSEGAVVTITAPVNMNVDSLQSLSSDGATLAVQQVMMGGQSEDESVDSTEDDGGELTATNISGLVLDNSDSLQ